MSASEYAYKQEHYRLCAENERLQREVDDLFKTVQDRNDELSRLQAPNNQKIVELRDRVDELEDQLDNAEYRFEQKEAELDSRLGAMSQANEGLEKANHQLNSQLEIERQQRERVISDHNLWRAKANDQLADEKKQRSDAYRQLAKAIGVLRKITGWFDEGEKESKDGFLSWLPPKADVVDRLNQTAQGGDLLRAVGEARKLVEAEDERISAIWNRAYQEFILSQLIRSAAWNRYAPPVRYTFAAFDFARGYRYSSPRTPSPFGS